MYDCTAVYYLFCHHATYACARSYTLALLSRCVPYFPTNVSDSGSYRYVLTFEPMILEYNGSSKDTDFHCKVPSSCAGFPHIPFPADAIYSRDPMHLTQSVPQFVPHSAAYTPHPGHSVHIAPACLSPNIVKSLHTHICIGHSFKYLLPPPPPPLYLMSCCTGPGSCICTSHPYLPKPHPSPPLPPSGIPVLYLFPKSRCTGPR